MNNKYLSQLPDAIKRMVEQVESLIGSEIALRPRNADDLQHVPDPSLPVCDCHMVGDIMHVSIAVPSEEIARHVLIHEILHAYRNVCLAVPRLAPADDSDGPAGRFSMRIENDVEHLFIIPEEAKHAAEALNYWYNHYDGQLDNLRQLLFKPNQTQFDALASREALLHAWVVTSRCIPNWSGHSALQDLLQEASLLKEATQFSAKIKQAYPNKARCLAVAVRCLKLDPNRHRLERYLVKERRIDRVKLPSL